MSGFSKALYRAESLRVNECTNNLKTDECYTEKTTSGYNLSFHAQPISFHPPEWICEMQKCWQPFLLGREREKSYLLLCESWYNNPVKAFFHIPHYKTFGLKNSLEIDQRWWVQSRSLGYKHLLKRFAKFLLWGMIMWAGGASLGSLGGADSNVWTIQHFH